MAVKKTERESISFWNNLIDNILRSTPVDNSETHEEKLSRIKKLEADPLQWFKYYFPKYTYADFAPFHKRYIKKFINNDRIFAGCAWSREMAKDAVTMFCTLYLALTGKVRNIILCSYTNDNATNLLAPYRINLERNQRIINDYGVQEKYGSWSENNFTTTGGVTFLALGAKESPRGTRNEEIRPDLIIISDLENDEMSRNQKRLDDVWKWVEQALIPTVSVSGNIRVTFLGNIISKNGIMVKAQKICDFYQIINIRNNEGKSSWPQKNKEEHIEWILAKLSYASQQKEYFNNPINEGTVFKEMRWDKIPPLSKFPFLVAYGDPSQSNKENKNNSYKFVGLIGILDGTCYVVNCFLDRVNNATFIRWYWDLLLYVNEKALIYNYIENNTLQDPFYQQVFKPLIFAESQKNGIQLFVTPDERKKPDKFIRIEGNLEPLHRNGKLILNEKEKNNPHMLRLEEQFKSVEPTLSVPVDGPDGVEGGHWIYKQKTVSMQPPTFGLRRTSSKRF